MIKMKINLLRKKMKEKEIDLFISTSHAKYLSETNSASALIITENKNILLTTRMEYDLAREESPIKEVRSFAEVKVPTRKNENIQFGKFEDILQNVIQEIKPESVGYDSLNEKSVKKLEETLQNPIKEESELVWNLRMKKTPEEIKHMKKSAEIARKGMKKARELIGSNLTEKEIATEIEYEMRKHGSEGYAFETIVASGNNSIHPHSKPSERKVKSDDLTIVDLGARWKNYCSDMSRTFCPKPSEKQKKIMNLVKKAQKKALEKIEAGKKSKKLDEVARKVFRGEKLEKYYLHSTGHGLGLEIHEPPRISQNSEKTLKENMVITIEPGIYLENTGGCRYEDTVIVKENGFEKITSL